MPSSTPAAPTPPDTLDEMRALLGQLPGIPQITHDSVAILRNIETTGASA